MLNAHLYDWKEIVIGGTLNAAKDALERGSYFIFNNVNRIFALDVINNEDDLGVTEKKLFEDCVYELNTLGLCPLANSCRTINISKEENILKIISNEDNKFNIKYSNLHVYDYENVNGLPFDLPKPAGYNVYDWYDVKSGMKHKYNKLLDIDSAFVNKVYFYNSERFKGRVGYKDLVARSYLEQDSLLSVSSDPAHARLKILNMLNSAGIKGASSGPDRYRPVDIHFSKRQIIPKYNTIYIQKDNIKLSLED
jgi:hypothetical protein